MSAGADHNPRDRWAGLLRPPPATWAAPRERPRHDGVANNGPRQSAVHLNRPTARWSHRSATVSTRRHVPPSGSSYDVSTTSSTPTRTHLHRWAARSTSFSARWGSLLRLNRGTISRHEFIVNADVGVLEWWWCTDSAFLLCPVQTIVLISHWARRTRWLSLFGSSSAIVSDLDDRLPFEIATATATLMAPPLRWRITDSGAAIGMKNDTFDDPSFSPSVISILSNKVIAAI